VYVNRTTTGAVVGRQPFGGWGMSGVGTKAGGPDYLHRLSLEQVVTVNTAASGGNAALLSEEEGAELTRPMVAPGHRNPPSWAFILKAPCQGEGSCLAPCVLQSPPRSQACWR